MLHEVVQRSKANPILNERDCLEHDVGGRGEIAAIVQHPADRLDHITVANLAAYQERIDPRGVDEDAQGPYVSAK